MTRGRYAHIPVTHEPDHDPHCHATPTDNPAASVATLRREHEALQARYRTLLHAAAAYLCQSDQRLTREAMDAYQALKSLIEEPS